MRDKIKIIRTYLGPIGYFRNRGPINVSWPEFVDDKLYKHHTIEYINSVKLLLDEWVIIGSDAFDAKYKFIDIIIQTESKGFNMVETVLDDVIPTLNTISDLISWEVISKY